VRRGKKYSLPDMRRRRRKKRPGSAALTAQVTAKNQTAHAVGDHVHLIHRLAVGESQPGQKRSERIAQILDRRG